MIQVDETLLAYAEKYREAFGCMPPLRMLPPTLTNEELCAQIDDCIARGVNDLETRYGLTDEEDILY